MLETTDAFKKMADGRSWEQLEFQEQQQIRTLAILEQANKQFGSGISRNTATSISELSGAMADLKIASGELASSALVPLTTVLTGVVRGAASAVSWFSGLSGTSKTYLGIAAALALGIPAVTIATKGLALAQAGLHAAQAILIPQTVTFGAVLKAAFGWISLAALAIGILYAVLGKKNTSKSTDDMKKYNDSLKNTSQKAFKASEGIDSITDSTHALSDEMKRALAGFDELNILNSDGSTGNNLFNIDTAGIDSAAAALGAFDDARYNIDFDTNAVSTAGTIKSVLSEMWKNVKSGFSDWCDWWE